MRLACTIGLVAAVLTISTFSATAPAGAAEAKDAKSAGRLASLWVAPTDDGKVQLLLAGQEKPIAVAVNSDTVFTGICLDCMLLLDCKPAQLTKNCNVCGCSVSNAECLIGKKLKTGTWQEMLKLLPRGEVVRAVFNDPDKPESGAKKIVIDRRAVLLPVDGLASQSPDQLAALVKPLTGTKVELLADGKQLSVTLKEDWTADREAKLEKAIEGAGGKVVALPVVATPAAAPATAAK